MPEPETPRLEIVIVALPEFASLMVCVASLPTVTLPKLTDDGVIASADAFPDPVQSAVSVELDPLAVTVSAPDSVEVDVGLNVAVTLALFPAATVAGRVKPESVIPFPVTLTFEIVALALPEFVIFTVCVAVVPIATLPKLIESGESASELATPCPFSGIVVGESSALLVIVTAPVEAPLDAALNDTFTCSDFPAANVAGVDIPDTVNPAPETEIFVMLADSVPSFVTVNVCVSPDPTDTLPKLSVAGATEIATLPAPLPPPTAPLPVVPTQPDVIRVAANVTTANVLRSVLAVENFPERWGVFPAASRCVCTSLITEAIVACATRDALLSPGTHLGQVCTTGQRDRPALSASSAVQAGRWGFVLARAEFRFSPPLGSCVAQNYGITAVAWFEYALSLSLESTAVTT
jgi:hypothetical protein